jgi:hypothetical protein
MVTWLTLLFVVLMMESLVPRLKPRFETAWMEDVNKKHALA